MSKVAPQILDLLEFLQHLPGFGQRSARRLMLQLLDFKNNRLNNLRVLLKALYNNIVECEICGNLDNNTPCNICTDETRQQNILCVVENISHIWVLEKSLFNKRVMYHVLRGNLSAIMGKNPNNIGINALLDRVKQNIFEEVILALSPTLEGNTTGFYIYNQLMQINKNLRVTLLAKGLPIGLELDNADTQTLEQALRDRRVFKGD